jgi:hypothetical protein
MTERYQASEGSLGQRVFGDFRTMEQVEEACAQAS